MLKSHPQSDEPKSKTRSYSNDEKEKEHPRRKTEPGEKIVCITGACQHSCILQKLSGIQPAGRERRKAKNGQLQDSNPECLTKAAINHRAMKPPQKPASTILLSYYTGGTVFFFSPFSPSRLNST